MSTDMKRGEEAGVPKKLVKLFMERGKVKKAVVPLLKGKSLNERARILGLYCPREMGNRAERRRMLKEAVKERARR